jgi:hypothetical protein
VSEHARIYRLRPTAGARKSKTESA